MSSVLGRLQRGLERLYRVDTQLQVEAFVVGEEDRQKALGGAGRRPREQLLVSEERGELSLGLFLDDTALENLALHDPAQGLSAQNFGDFCLAVEGVSHFIYVAVCAAGDRSVTALELELQAEVDKFVSCTLIMGEGGRPLRERLFQNVTYDKDLDDDEKDRYRTANTEAHRYARSLHRRFLHAGHVDRMLTELRRFYRFGLPEKLEHIAQAA